ncbi:MAG: nucleotidyltransferase family protein [Lachnospiraceae bacterium]|nr:nucleotidyltransferase family protein [Lachnospiraceae bacterium]
MNQLLFEGRSLAGIVSSIIRQDALRVSYSRLDWEHMFRIADYHKVANIVYLGILGYRDSLPEKWWERFFEKYQESLLFGENYKDSIREVLTWLDMRGISCTVLISEAVRELYQIPEAADVAPLQIFLNEEKYNLVKGYLIDLGYETDQVYSGLGERFQRVSSIPISLFHKLPFRTTGYDRNMRRILETAILREPYKYIRILPVESEFLFRIAGAAYRYVTDELTMREVLDLQLCHRAWRDHIRKDAVKKRLGDFQVDELAEKLLRLSYMWFGDKKDQYYEGPPENMAEYDVLEERLLTRGMVNHEADEQALKLQKLVQKELDKEKREEEKKKRKERRKERWEKMQRWFRWAFPDYHYMSSIYPKVEKIPALLPVFWIVRGVRLIWRALAG